MVIAAHRIVIWFNAQARREAFDHFPAGASLREDDFTAIDLCQSCVFMWLIKLMGSQNGQYKPFVGKWHRSRMVKEQQGWVMCSQFAQARSILRWRTQIKVGSEERGWIKRKPHWIRSWFQQRSSCCLPVKTTKRVWKCSDIYISTKNDSYPKDAKEMCICWEISNRHHGFQRCETVVLPGHGQPKSGGYAGAWRSQDEDEMSIINMWFLSNKSVHWLIGVTCDFFCVCVCACVCVCVCVFSSVCVSIVPNFAGPPWWSTCPAATEGMFRFILSFY